MSSKHLTALEGWLISVQYKVMLILNTILDIKIQMNKIFNQNNYFFESNIIRFDTAN